jgi:hypothetical protein
VGCTKHSSELELSDFPESRLDDAANLVLSGALCVPGDRDRVQQESVDAGESHAGGHDVTVAISSSGTGASARTYAGTITDDLGRHFE